MTGVSREIDQLITRLAPETRRQRQSALLRPLNYSLIILAALGLVVMIVRGSVRDSFLTVGASLVVNVLVGLLDRAGKTQLAGYIFVIMVNLGCFAFFRNNLHDHALISSVLFGSQLAMCVMLAGLLLGTSYIFLFAGVNVTAVWAILWRYFSASASPPSLQPLYDTFSLGLPISSFLVLIAVITWLYQRALRQAEERVEIARKRIIQDELIRRDLALARELQLRLFPPPPLTSPALRIATRTEPARETSGDFYDFVELGDGMLGMIVADVTGKSVAAALMMALARVTIRSEARRHASPAEVLRAANETICRDHTTRQLITAFYGVLDTRAMTVRFANAGHPYPILRRASHLTEVELVGVPLGGRPEGAYGELTIQLEPGDQLFLISDGLVEERNASREMFGYTRLGTAILATDPHDPERALESLWQTVTRFRGGVEQSDDITLVVIQVALGENRAVLSEC